MNASTIMQAVAAIRAVDSLDFQLLADPFRRARAMNDLCAAANALEAELGAINIQIEESAAAVPSSGGLGSALPAVHAVAADHIYADPTISKKDYGRDPVYRDRDGVLRVRTETP